MNARLLLRASFWLWRGLFGCNELLLGFIWVPCPGLLLVCFGNIIYRCTKLNTYKIYPTLSEIMSFLGVMDALTVKSDFLATGALSALQFVS